MPKVFRLLKILGIIPPTEYFRGSWMTDMRILNTQHKDFTKRVQFLLHPFPV